MTYAEQLKHPKWQQKRLEVMEHAGFECHNCGDKDKTLNVHHKRYEKGKKAWEYPIENFLCLCETCHEKLHQNKDILDSVLAKINMEDVGMVVGYIKALLSDYGPTEFSIDSPEEAAGASDFFRVNVGIPMGALVCDEPAMIDKLRHITQLVHGGCNAEDPWRGYRIRRGQ